MTRNARQIMIGQSNRAVSSVNYGKDPHPTPINRGSLFIIQKKKIQV